MPIKVAAAPKDAIRILKTGIQHLAGADDTLRRVEGLSDPHRAFNLGLDELVRSKQIATAAKHVGWRFQLVDRKKRVIAAAELFKTRAGLRFANISYGPHATDSGAQTAAARWSRRKKADHEMTLLRVPGAFCIALWLRSTDGAPDAFVPIPPCPPGLTPNKIYAEEEFRAALLPDATKQLAAPGPNQRQAP
jgi:hypothetical protein